MDGTGGDAALAAAVTHLQRGEYAAARPLLEEAVGASSEDAVAQAYLGMTLFHLYDAQGAKEHLDRAVALGAEEFLAWAKRGEYWLHLGCYPQACADLRRALRLPPPSPSSRLRVAQLLEETRQRSKHSFVRTAASPPLNASWVGQLAGALGASFGALRRRLPRHGTVAPELAPEPAVVPSQGVA
jgi:tetratricopeptide (TPR) repeat protein